MTARPYTPVIIGAPARGRPDEDDTRESAGAVAAALARLGFDAEIVEIDLDLSVLERLAARKPHVVFNLYEATRGDAGLSYLPCPALDHLGVPYTGARTEAYFLTLTKLLTKRLLRASGLPTPDWWADGLGAEGEARVIVKSDREHASYGMDAGSVVPGRLAAREIAARQARFGGRFIAEAFVEGREINVALLETPGGVQVLPIPEITFEGYPEGRPRIVDYESKWAAESALFAATSRAFGLEASDPALAARAAELARASWDAFGLAGYARVDMRVGADGPTILEINVNPCLDPGAGFAATAAQAGIGYDELIAAIVEAARMGGSPVIPSEARDLGTSPGPRRAPPAATFAEVPRFARDDRLWRTSVRPVDVSAVRSLVTATARFTSTEVAIAGELVEERLAKGEASGYDFVFAESAAGELLGYACWGATPGTDATFDLYWIAVAPGAQGGGLGRALLARVEADARARGGRALYAHTSGTDAYAPTRAFYERTGFAEAARLRDFYRPGDDNVIYRKEIAPVTAHGPSAETRPKHGAEAAGTDFFRARPSLAGPGLSPGRGRGLFALADIPAGTLIERACTVEILEDQSTTLDRIQPIGDFYFEHPENPRAGLMAFGLMSLLNHAETPNADVRFERDPAAGWLIDLVATRAIAAGEEITYRYKCPLWW